MAMELRSVLCSTTGGCRGCTPLAHPCWVHRSTAVQPFKVLAACHVQPTHWLLNRDRSMDDIQPGFYNRAQGPCICAGRNPALKCRLHLASLSADCT